MHIHTETIVPIFMVSNVSMQGIDNIHMFLNILPKAKERSEVETAVECQLDHAWTVPGVGTVVGGHLITGCVRIGDKLWFGPNNNQFVQVTIRSIHCKKVSVQQVSTRTYICLALRGITKADYKRGNVLLERKEQQILCSELLVDVEVLKTHSTTIKPGYQPIMHVQNIRTSVTIHDIHKKICGRQNKDWLEQNDKILRTGDSAELHLKLCFEKKFIKEGAHVLLCEGRTKVVGRVKSIW